MGGPGLEVAKFTFYVFMPMAFMVYFGGPGFYERFVADDVYKFNPPNKKQDPPTEHNEISRALEDMRTQRGQRKREREQAMEELRNKLKQHK